MMMTSSIKVHINSVGILNTINLWIILRIIVIYLVGWKFHLHGLFRRLIWRSHRKWRQSRHAFGKKQCLEQRNIRLSHDFLYFHDNTKRILNPKKMPNGWVVYAFSILAYFNITSVTSLPILTSLRQQKSPQRWNSWLTKYITIFLRIIRRLKVFKIPTEFIRKMQISFWQWTTVITIQWGHGSY